MNNPSNSSSNPTNNSTSTSNTTTPKRHNSSTYTSTPSNSTPYSNSSNNNYNKKGSYQKYNANADHHHQYQNYHHQAYNPNGIVLNPNQLNQMSAAHINQLNAAAMGLNQLNMSQMNQINQMGMVYGSYSPGAAAAGLPPHAGMPHHLATQGGYYLPPQYLGQQQSQSSASSSASPAHQHQSPQAILGSPNVGSNLNLSGATTPVMNKVKITTKDGEKVNFPPPTANTSSKSPVKTPLANSAASLASTPKPSSTPLKPIATPTIANASPVKSSENKSVIDEFKKKFQEQMEKKRLEKERAKAASASVAGTPPSTATTTAAPSTTAPATTDAPTPESKTEEKAKPKDEVPEVPIKTESIEDRLPEESDTKDESKVSSDAVEGEAQVESTNEEVKATDIEEQSADPSVIVVEEEPESGFTISKYFELLSQASPIDDPFTFTYPEGIVGPPKELTETCKSKKFRYNPSFLYLFADVVKYPADAEWKEKIEKTIVLTKGSVTGGNVGGNDAYKGKGMGSRMGSSRNFSGMDSRQNSKSGSKRRMNNNNNNLSGRDRSNRKNNNSKRDNTNRNNSMDSDQYGDNGGSNEPAVEIPKVLPKSANRWVPRSRAPKVETRYSPDGTEIFEVEDVERKVNSSLNKLTLEKFEEITNEIIEIAHQAKYENDAATVKQIIQLTYAKACDEPHWSGVYAQFCAKLCKEIPPEVKDETNLDKNGNPVCGGTLVRKILLNRCQTEYEKGWSDKLPTNADGSALEPEMMSDEYYKAAAAKRRGLGLVKFIGEMYLLHLLSDQVIFYCIDGQSKNTEDPSEDTLESLCQLLASVGKLLDERNVSAILNRTFDRIQIILDKADIPSRIKFMLMDLQDLRNRKWASKSEDLGPKTIQAIREEDEKKREEERLQQDKRRQNKDNRTNMRQSGWGAQQQHKVSQNDIKNVGVMRNSDRTLGPMNSFNRSRSSRNNSNNSNSISNNNSNNNSTRENSRRETSYSNLQQAQSSQSIQPSSSLSNINRYAALLDDDDDQKEVEHIEAHVEEHDETEHTMTQVTETTEAKVNEDQIEIENGEEVKDQTEVVDESSTTEEAK